MSNILANPYPEVYQPYINAGGGLGYDAGQVYEAMRPVPRHSDYAELDIDGLDAPVPSWRMTTHKGWQDMVPHPGKGGIRYHPDVDRAETEGLTVTMLAKNTLHGLPYDGAKGGVQIDPSILTPEQRTQLNHKHALAHDYHPLHNVGATDINTLPSDMDDMVDALTERYGDMARACVTGTTRRFSDLASFRDGSTGIGASLVLDEYIQWRSGWDPTMAQVVRTGGKIAAIVQGNGKAAGPFNQNLPENVGLRAVSERYGAVRAKSGFLDPAIITELARTTNFFHPEFTVSLPNNIEWIPNDEFWATPTEVVVPGAMGHEITAERVAKFGGVLAVLGIANNPVTTDAADLMRQSGIDDIIDRLTNAGGVAGSYYEWAKQLHTFGHIDVEPELGTVERAWEQRMRSVARVTLRGVSRMRAEAGAEPNDTRAATIADSADRLIVQSIMTSR